MRVVEWHKTNRWNRHTYQQVMRVVEEIHAVNTYILCQHTLDYPYRVYYIGFIIQDVNRDNELIISQSGHPLWSPVLRRSFLDEHIFAPSISPQKMGLDLTDPCQMYIHGTSRLSLPSASRSMMSNTSSYKLSAWNTQHTNSSFEQHTTSSFRASPLFNKDVSHIPVV